MQPFRGFSLGRPLGSPLSVHGSWVPAAALLVAHLSFVAYGDRGLLGAVALGVITAAGYFVGVLLHTAAHIVVGRIVGSPPQAVGVFFFGDVSLAGPTTRRRNIWTALAGPVTSGAIAGGAFIFASGSNDVLRTIALGNGAIALLNLLPALPFDGGHMVAATSPRRRKLAVRAGIVIGLLAIVTGGYLLSRGPELLSETAFGLWLVLTGLFAIMQSNATAPSSSPIADLKDRTVAEWARPFAGRVEAGSVAPVGPGPFAVSHDGRLTGVITHPPGTRTRAADVMIPWTSDLNVPADASLISALEKLSSRATPILVVIDKQGVVRGVLDEDAVRAGLGAS
jgi:Zn-dependent protease